MFNLTQTLFKYQNVFMTLRKLLHCNEKQNFKKLLSWVSKMVQLVKVIATELDNFS